MADKPTILYIEDDPGSQTLVQRTLTFAGYRVVVAARGLEGLEMAVKELPDLILMDINLPDLSGREVTTRLRSDRRFRDVPIVALTALSQGGEREKALAAGATGYLTKPIDIDKLPGQVGRYLSGEHDSIAMESMLQAHTAYNQEIVEHLERKLRELEANNAELRRLEQIKDDFIQLTAHELRTPLTLVYGYGRLLQESPIVKQISQSDEIRSFMAGLIEAIERMTVVLNEILVVSRVATGRIALGVGPVNLAELIVGVTQKYKQATQQRNLLISFDRAQAMMMISADAELLALALSNVVGNAIKYTPDGGVINVSVRPGTTNVLITVQDTGIGISKDEQLGIFNRFYSGAEMQLHSTSKTAYRGGGLGLGLAICRGIIDAHGGRIWVESEGRDEERLPGSTFYIDLPLQAHLSSSPHRKL